MSRPLVVLLRARTAEDPFAAALAGGGFEVGFIPVLNFSFVGREALRQRLARAADYEAIILTSPRAVDAVRAAGEPGAWAGRRAYAVGPLTARRARELGLEVRGEDALTAEALAERIVEDAPRGPLLFLAGSRRRDVLPQRLHAAAVPFDELVVYHTTLAPPAGMPAEADWAVFFSPSGVEAARGAPTFPWNSVRRAAIGPTTAAALERAGHPPAAVAAEPSPRGLLAALRSAPNPS